MQKKHRKIESEADVKITTKITTKEMVFIGMFAAVLTVCSQIAIPLPSGIPVTLQTFAVALIGTVLAWKLGCATVFVYILLGAIGLPIFTGFRGGVQALVGHTGGFIWGFIILTLLCGAGSLCKNRIVAMLMGFWGLAICHLFGCLQFMFLTSSSFVETFLLVSFPYLLKDVISVILGILLGEKIRRQLWKAGLI
ncbi:MAG: biotin transporter BioY [Lachnospiraceae bacterium]|nr:biotin transporter BioY [Lachnospiraceae bacterium]